MATKANKYVIKNTANKPGDRFSEKDGMERMRKFLKRDNSIFMIKCWYRDGYSFQEMADKIGVSLKVFKEARNEIEEFDQALIESKECVDYKVENALLKSALGFTTKEVKVTTLMRYGKVVETQKEVLEKEYAPNVTAIQTWLYNRQKDKWRNMNVQKSLTDDMEEDSSIEITVKRASGNESKDTGVKPAEFENGETEEKEITLRKKSKEQIEKEKEKKQKELAENNEEDWSEAGDEVWEGVDE